MDLNQRKLNRDEWNGIEVPVNEREKMILNLIINGFNDVQIKQNNNLSFIDFLKITPCESITEYIYETYLFPLLKPLVKKYKIVIPRFNLSNIKMKKQDKIRLENSGKYFENRDETQELFEFKLIELYSEMLEFKHKDNNNKSMVKFYTIKILMGYNITNVNKILLNYLNEKIQEYSSSISKLNLIRNGYEIIEKNNNILKYADEELYEHQKQLFTISKRANPKLILYIAPTGTGKTLSPIGLSEKYRVIFVCAARHVGLALAKNAVSVNKKVAFAFGCNGSEDIRLHYFSAKDYVVHKRTGGIFKVDNTVGDKVEIMISDIKSYLPAMLYMLAFNPAEKIILYWDEPTITMDYQNHDLHSIIKRNWSENIIPNIVLSSATLPNEEEIRDTLTDFRAKFSGRDLEAEIHTIVSYDCKKTIPIINKEGFVEMPHYLYEEYNDIKNVVKHCEKFKTILRYLDLNEAVKFIVYMNEQKLIHSELDGVEHERNFPNIESVNMKNIKLYYLKLLKKIKREQWPGIYNYFKSTRVKKQNSNIYVSTEDAYTLTDGPTIFLADDTTKIASFCIQTAKIPTEVIRDLTEAISYNNVITNKIEILEKELEDGTTKDADKERKAGKDGDDKEFKGSKKGIKEQEMKRLKEKIENLRQMVKNVELNEMFVPNTRTHLKRFNHSEVSSAFTCDISDKIIEKIMQINGIEDSWKLLLMMGIGVFANQDNPTYMEIMRHLAQEQKLYMIIASSDYIYGTNYQFCHGYISKDLGNMSQEKCIQAMGRVGRNNLQSTYSLRFRDNELIYKLFNTEENRPEVINMNRLFQTEQTIN